MARKKKNPDPTPGDMPLSPAPGTGTVRDMMEEVRRVIGKYAHLPEREVMEALDAEGEGWSMRLSELEAEGKPPS